MTRLVSLDEVDWGIFDLLLRPVYEEDKGGGDHDLA
jgi:hypothetical protein